MTTNEILKKVYAIQPSIGRWARSGRPNVLWDNGETAKHGIAEYIGPRASDLVMKSLHIAGDDLTFIKTAEAYAAICEVVDAIYRIDYTQGPHLIDGLFVEEGQHATA